MAILAGWWVHLFGRTATVNTFFFSGRPIQTFVYCCVWSFVILWWPGGEGLVGIVSLVNVVQEQVVGVLNVVAFE